MINDDIFETELLVELISTIVNKAIKKYKIDYDKANHIVIETMKKHPKFLQLVDKQPTLKKILRSRSYDEVNNKARRAIYYELRQYKKNVETQQALIASLKQISSHPAGIDCRDIITKLVQTHVSTKERLGSLDYFYNELFRFTGELDSIVDVGCGMNPLIFPFAGPGKSVGCYAALDKDIISISALEVFSGILKGNILHAMNWNIKDKWEIVLNRTGIDRFDAAFLMKLVPVVSRVERDLLKVLLETPANIWLITGSKTSMTKYIKIERRERKIINHFIDQSGKDVIGEFSTDEEFCIIVK